MYAIVDIAGQQFKVEKDQKLYVHRLEGKEGNQVSFDKVLLIDSGSKILVGDPVVKGASVDAKIIAHVKGDKVLVFKKKRRKGYQKLNGHRQYMTQIQIEGITETGAKPGKTETAKKEAVKPAEEKQEAAGKPAARKKETAGKPAAQKKEAAGKPAAQKKEAAGKPAAQKKEAAGKPAAQKKETAGKPAAQKKEAAGKPDAQKKEAAGKPAAQKKETAGKPAAPKKGDDKESKE